MLCGMKNATATAPGKVFRGVDYVKITIIGFGISAMWSPIHTILLQVRLLDFVPEAQKNTYLGLLTFSGLVLAMLVQPLVGAASDRSRFRWGKRRPYILLGVSLTALFLFGMGVATSYTALFSIYCLMQISSNTAQGPSQALIPDLVPPSKHGTASGIKSLLEIAGGGALLYPMARLIDRYSAGQGTFWLWLTLGVLAAVLLGSMLVTVLSVREPAASGGAARQPLNPFASFHINLRGNRPFVWFLISRLLVFMSFTTIQTFALYFLADVTGISNPATATAQFSIVALLGMLSAVYPAASLSDRVGRRPVLVGAGLFGAFAIALIFFFRENYHVILGCAAMVGIAFGAFQATDWALATDLVFKSEEARYLGLANLANAGGAALARLIGPLIDFLNRFQALLGYLVMLLLCLVLFAVGALLVLKVRKPQPR